MWRVVRVLVVTVLCARTFTSARKQIQRVLNGVNDDTNKYPYVVLIVSADWTRSGTGSMIKPTWVLTVAHLCLMPSQAQFINYGDLAAPNIFGNTTSNIILKLMHPRFDAELLASRDMSRVNDIGLMEVSPPVTITTYGKLSAVDYKTFVGVSVQFAGFGIINTSDMWTPRKQPLKVGEGVIKGCSQIWKDHNLIGGYLCVAPKCSSPQAPLPGDSGAPLFCDNKIIAVVATGDPDQLETFNTPVSPYLTWIHKEITSRH